MKPRLADFKQTVPLRLVLAAAEAAGAHLPLTEEERRLMEQQEAEESRQVQERLRRERAEREQREQRREPDTAAGPASTSTAAAGPASTSTAAAGPASTSTGPASTNSDPAADSPGSAATGTDPASATPSVSAGTETGSACDQIIVTYSAETRLASAATETNPASAPTETNPASAATETNPTSAATETGPTPAAPATAAIQEESMGRDAKRQKRNPESSPERRQSVSQAGEPGGERRESFSPAFDSSALAGPSTRHKSGSSTGPLRLSTGRAVGWSQGGPKSSAAGTTLRLREFRIRQRLRLRASSCAEDDPGGKPARVGTRAGLRSERPTSVSPQRRSRRNGELPGVLPITSPGRRGPCSGSGGSPSASTIRLGLRSAGPAAASPVESPEGRPAVPPVASPVESPEASPRASFEGPSSDASTGKSTEDASAPARRARKGRRLFHESPVPEIWEQASQEAARPTLTPRCPLRLVTEWLENNSESHSSCGDSEAEFQSPQRKLSRRASDRELDDPVSVPAPAAGAAPDPSPERSTKDGDGKSAAGSGRSGVRSGPAEAGSASPAVRAGPSGQRRSPAEAGSASPAVRAGPSGQRRSPAEAGSAVPAVRAGPSGRRRSPAEAGSASPAVRAGPSGPRRSRGPDIILATDSSDNEGVDDGGLALMGGQSDRQPGPAHRESRRRPREPADRGRGRPERRDRPPAAAVRQPGPAHRESRRLRDRGRLERRDRPPAAAVRPGRRYDTDEEDILLREVLSMDERGAAIGGNRVWQDMERSGVLPGRSWHSLKQHWRVMAPKLRDDERLTEDQRDRLCSGPKEKRTVPTRRYTKREDVKVLMYLKEQGAVESVSGRDVWERMAFRFVASYGLNRTWQSLKERFYKRIVPSLDSFREVPSAFRKRVKETLNTKRNASIALGHMEGEFSEGSSE